MGFPGWSVQMLGWLRWLATTKPQTLIWWSKTICKCVSPKFKCLMLSAGYNLMNPFSTYWFLGSTVLFSSISMPTSMISYLSGHKYFPPKLHLDTDFYTSLIPEFECLWRCYFSPTGTIISLLYLPSDLAIQYTHGWKDPYFQVHIKEKHDCRVRTSSKFVHPFKKKT